MDPLISLPSLAARLNDPDLVVLDATLPPVGISPPANVAARYRERHLPGALFFDIEALSDQETSLPHMLPSPKDFAESMSALGVSNAATIVVYEQSGIFSAPRAWWMLRTIGVRSVFVLDGDLQAWEDAGYPIEAGPVTRAPAEFVARLDQHAVITYEQLRAALPEGTDQVLDARSAGRFAGTAPEPRAGLRSGHMPGAVSLPYTELVEEGRLRSKEALQAVFARSGLDLSRPIITTCGSGVTAAVLALGLDRCSAENVRLYDGSWAEYAQQPNASIV